MSACDQGSFSFKEFYKRRIFRLVPATLSTLVVTTALAAFLLIYSDWVDFKSQLLGTLTFTANFVFMFESHYFGSAAERMPLLHMWSLAVEEQFYLFAPIIIFFTPRGWRTPVFGVATLLSAAVCFTMIFGWIDLPVSTKSAQSIAFYMLPTRAWELIAGCLGAWIMLKNPNLQIPVALKWIGLVGIAVLLVAPIGTSHPGQSAVVVVVLTMLLLLGRDNWLPGSAAITGVRKIGDWSYSIYLVHWPLFAFSSTIFVMNPPIWVSIALVFASVGLGALQYRFVETKFRYGWKSKNRHSLLGLCVCVAALALVALPGVTTALHPVTSRISTPPANSGLSPLCNQDGGRFSDLPDCRTQDDPHVALFGDSIAMQWGGVLGESAEALGGLIQITKAACTPASGLAQVNARYSETWAADCITFVEESTEWIIESDSIQTVVISSLYAYILKPQGQSFLSDGQITNVDSGAGLSAARATIERFVDAGKSVVLIGTPAMTGADYGACQTRRLSGLITLGTENCTFGLSEYQETFATVVNGLEALGQMEGVTLVWPHESYCDQGTCQTVLLDTVLYRDRTHLTLEGTSIIAEDLNLIELLANGSEN